MNTDKLISDELTKGLNNVASFRHQSSLNQAIQFLNSSLSNMTVTRDSYYKELIQYRNNYIVNGIYDILSNDILNDTSDADTILISVPKDQDIEEEIKKLFDRLGMTELIQSILPDLLHFGSYPLRPIVKEGKGVIDIVDDLYPNQVLALTDSKNNPIVYYVNDSVQNNSMNIGLNNYANGYQANANRKKFNYKYMSVGELVYFSIDLTFSKLLLPEEESQSIRDKSPDFISNLLPRTLRVKTSQSFIYPVLDKLKEVLALDKYTVYKSIGEVLTPKLIGIPLPQTYDVNQLSDITETYNTLINDNIMKTNNLQNMEVTLQELSSVKVIPIAGDRATPQLIDVGRTPGDSNSNIEALKDALGRLLTALGLSEDHFTGQGLDPRENLKVAIRYAKKVKRISKNIARTLKIIALIHISEKFPEKNIKLSDIGIQLRNNLNVDELQNLETQDLVIASVDNILTLLSNLNDVVEGTDYEIDRNLVVENVKGVLALANSPFLNVLKLKETSSVTAKEVINQISDDEGRPSTDNDNDEK